MGENSVLSKKQKVKGGYFRMIYFVELGKGENKKQCERRDIMTKTITIFQQNDTHGCIQSLLRDAGRFKIEGNDHIITV